MSDISYPVGKYGTRHVVHATPLDEPATGVVQVLRLRDGEVASLVRTNMGNTWAAHWKAGRAFAEWKTWASSQDEYTVSVHGRLMPVPSPAT